VQQSIKAKPNQSQLNSSYISQNSAAVAPSAKGQSAEEMKKLQRVLDDKDK
jgi:hypothetical protein